MTCSPLDGSVYAGHAWEYATARFSGEPYRRCSSCGRVEVYYLDDLELERELGLA